MFQNNKTYLNTKVHTSNLNHSWVTWGWSSYAHTPFIRVSC